MAEPEDLPGELALAAGQDQAASLELRVERLPVEVVRDERRGHRLRGVALVGEELEAERGEPGARCGGADLVAGEDVLLALGLHEPQALVDLEDDRDRGRERRLPVCRGVPVRPQVEIEARHRRRLHRRPAARRGGDHRQARCGHPGLLRAGHDHVDAPRVHLERDGAETGHAVDEDQRVGRLLVDGCGQFGDRVHHPGRRLVVGEQDRLRVGHAAQPLADLRTVRRVAPFGVELGDVRAVDAGDLREPVAERADAHAEDAVAGRQRVDDRRLEPAGPRGRDHRHVGRRPEVGLHALEDPGEHRRELGTPVVDHLPRTRLADAGWQRGGARDAQVRLEAGHGTLLVAEQGGLMLARLDVTPLPRHICRHMTTRRTTILLDTDLLDRLDRFAHRQRTTKTSVLACGRGGLPCRARHAGRARVHRGRTKRARAPLARRAVDRPARDRAARAVQLTCRSCSTRARSSPRPIATT